MMYLILSKSDDYII